MDSAGLQQVHLSVNPAATSVQELQDRHLHLQADQDHPLAPTPPTPVSDQGRHSIPRPAELNSAATLVVAHRLILIIPILVSDQDLPRPTSCQSGMKKLDPAIHSANQTATLDRDHRLIPKIQTLVSDQALPSTPHPAELNSAVTLAPARHSAIQAAISVQDRPLAPATLAPDQDLHSIPTPDLVQVSVLALVCFMRKRVASAVSAVSQVHSVHPELAATTLTVNKAVGLDRISARDQALLAPREQLAQNSQTPAPLHSIDQQLPFTLLDSDRPAHLSVHQALTILALAQDLTELAVDQDQDSQVDLQTT